MIVVYKRDAAIKLVYVVIDGVGDRPIKELGGKTPLEAAETPNLDMLAKIGKTGLMYTVQKGIAPESDIAVLSILGYDPFKYHVGRGPLEAYGAGLDVKLGCLALRCNFATVDSEGRIIDRRVGRSLTTEEASKLAEVINREVKLESHPADFQFKSTFGHRAVLVIRSLTGQPLSSGISNTDPAYERVKGLGVAKLDAEMILRRCEPQEETYAAKISADLVNEFVEKSRQVLEEHPVNKRRLEDGKLAANVILTRDAGSHLPKFFNINEKYKIRFLCLADMPVERGIARLAGMQLVDIPPPSHNIAFDMNLRVNKLLENLPLYDCFYIHIKGPDEPGHDGNYQLKKEIIKLIDEHFFGKLLSKIDLKKTVLCVTADHSTPCELKAHSDDPVPLLISGGPIPPDETSHFSERECSRGSLGTLERGTELIPLLMKFIGRAS